MAAGTVTPAVTAPVDIEPVDIADKIDSAERNESALANDANDAALPIESTESWEQIDRTELRPQGEHA